MSSPSCSGSLGGNGGTPDGVSGTNGGTCSYYGGGGATQTAAGVSSGGSAYSGYNGQGMVGGIGLSGGGGGQYGGAGGASAAGGGGSSMFAAGSTIAGLAVVGGAYRVAAAAVSGSVSITHTLLANTQAFSYLSDAAQSYTIPSGTEYLDFIVIG